MNILIVEDDFASRKFLMSVLSKYGSCDVAVDGEEAIVAFKAAVASGTFYNLVCLDIMLPGIDGQEVLRQIRQIEADNSIPLGDKDRGARVVMTTALDDSKNFMQSLRTGCEGYVPKPIDKNRLIKTLREIGLIE